MYIFILTLYIYTTVVTARLPRIRSGPLVYYLAAIHWPLKGDCKFTCICCIY